MNVTLQRIEPVAEYISTFWFQPDHKTSYIAGQYIEMYLPHDNADERGQKHWFTLSSSPTEDLLAITTKHYVDHQVSTFKQHLFAKEPGDSIKLSEPMGDFVLPKDSSIPLVFVVGGIGVTPIRSIVKWLYDIGEKRDIQLLYGARTLPEVAFRELFDAYGLKPVIKLSEPTDGWDGPTGHITAEDVLRLTGGHENALIYISGPEPLTESLEKDLKAQGVSGDRLVLDFFPGYPVG